MSEIGCKITQFLANMEEIYQKYTKIKFIFSKNQKKMPFFGKKCVSLQCQNI